MKHLSSSGGRAAPIHQARPALLTCIQRCARADANGYSRGQAARRCAEHLARLGTSPAVASASAAAGRRLGEWLAQQP